MIPLLVLLLSKVKRHHVATLLGLALASVLLGATLFSVTQQVSFGTALYWALVTAATVGYGDVTPHDAVGRIIAAGLILTAIPLFGAVFALVAGFAALVQIRRLFGMEHALPEGASTVVYGYHPAVPRIIEELVRTGRAVALVADVDPGEVHHQVRLLAGDPTNEEVLRKSHPERAAEALVVGSEDGDVLITCVALRALAPELPVFALASSPKVAQALRELGVHRTLSADDLVAHTLAKSLEAPHAGDLLLRLVDSERYVMEEMPVRDDMVGLPVTDVRPDHPAIVLGVVRGGDVTLVLDEDPVVRSGDVLITLATRRPPRSSRG